MPHGLPDVNGPQNVHQAAIGSHAGTLEIDLEGGVERELTGLILYLTHSVLASKASSSRSHPHEY